MLRHAVLGAGGVGAQVSALLDEALRIQLLGGGGEAEEPTARAEDDSLVGRIERLEAEVRLLREKRDTI